MSEEETNQRALLDLYPEDQTLINYKTDSDLINAFKEQKTMISQSIRIPSEDADETARQEFYNKVVKNSNGRLMPKPDKEDEAGMATIRTIMGKPDESKEYGFPEVDGLSMTDDRKAFMQELALTNNLGKDQFNGMVQGVLEAEAADHKLQGDAMKAAQEGLQAEWGQAFNGKMDRIKQVASSTGAPQEVQDSIRDGRAGPETLKWLDSVAETLTGKSMEINQQPNVAQIGMTPAEAKIRVSELVSKMQATGYKHNTATDVMDSDLRKLTEYQTLAMNL